MIYLHHAGRSCALLPSSWHTSYCRVPIPPDATEPAEEPTLADTCRACLIELVRDGALPTSHDPRRWAHWQRVTRDLRRGTGDWDVESSGSAARRWG